MTEFRNHVPSLDGLRGVAALWVFIGHALLLTGFSLPILGRPGLGVDLFIVLSGFLMAFQYRLRQEKEPWDKGQTWRRFWARRFFRIAPLYYLTLAVALFLAPVMYETRSSIGMIIGGENNGLERYLDRSMTNILLHLSLLFGIFPAYAFRTVLPDWSISLEVQFYLAFPFIMVAIERWGWTKVMPVLAVAGFLAGVAASRWASYPMPAFLPLKLHLFLSGMLIAEALRRRPGEARVLLGIALVVAALPVGGNNSPMLTALRLCIVLVFAGLTNHRLLPGIADTAGRRIGEMLGIPALRWLGELSYGAYLIHIMVLLPVCARLAAQPGLDGPARFMLAMSICLPVTYALAAIGYLLIERPGQRLGRHILSGDHRSAPVGHSRTVPDARAGGSARNTIPTEANWQ